MKDNSAFYDAAGVLAENAPFTERSVSLFSRIEEECRALVFPDCRVLEIGCGNGRFSFMLETLGALPTGIDVVESLIDYANGYARENGFKAEFFAMNACDMSGLGGKFDIIFLVQNNVVEFSKENFARLTEQAKSLLNPDGKFFMEFVARDAAYAENEDSYEIPGKGVYSYISYTWNANEISEILKSTFRKIKRIDKGNRSILIAGN